jgi:hypothetical protein
MGKTSTYDLDESPAIEDYFRAVKAATGGDVRVQFGDLASLISVADWISISDGLTYSSYDSTNKTVVWTTASDWRAKIGPGTRIRLSQSTGGTKYMLVVAISSTTITCYMGTDYSAASETVTSPVYSNMKAPIGFPIDPTKWTQTVTSTSTAAMVSGSWANTGSISLSVPIGLWYLSFQVHSNPARSANSVIAKFGLSESTTALTSGYEDSLELLGQQSTGATSAYMFQTCRGDMKRSYASATTVYLIQNGLLLAGSSNLYISETGYRHYIKALCAYL